jgi:hypothetical protein
MDRHTSLTPATAPTFSARRYAIARAVKPASPVASPGFSGSSALVTRAIPAMPAKPADLPRFTAIPLPGGSTRAVGPGAR